MSNEGEESDRPLCAIAETNNESITGKWKISTRTLLHDRYLLNERVGFEESDRPSVKAIAEAISQMQ